MAVTTLPDPTAFDQNVPLTLNMATSTVSAALGDERNGSGLEPNGHVSPANSQPDTTNAQRTPIPDDTSAQKQLKSTQVGNKDAFTLNQSVSAMTPPALEAVVSTEDSAKADAPESSDIKDTEMVDAPTESAKPPSPPAEPAADVPDVPTANSADAGEAAKPSPKPSQSPSAVETTEAAVKPDTGAGADQETTDVAETKTDVVTEAVDTQTTSATEAAPGDLMTPTTSMSKMALEGVSQESAAAEPLTADTSMTDAPSQASAKVAREREDDEDGEPAAKRARVSAEAEARNAEAEAEATDTPDAMVVDHPEKAPVPSPAPAVVSASESRPAANGSPAPLSTNGVNGSPAPLSTNGSARMLGDPTLENNPITGYQNKEIRKVLGLIKKTKAGATFKQSVQVLWPTLWEQYRQVIPRPVDIGSIEQNLRDNKYSSIGQFKKDVHLIEGNAVAFNGVNHDVSKWAKSTVEQIFNRLALISAQEPAKPVRPEPKQLPSRQTELRKPAPAPPKKEARPVANLPADKPNDSQTDRYALLPSGIPNIRRDITKTDVDRPKRPIHPPKSRDIGFPAKTARNKKKPELRFCEEVLKELTKHGNWQWNQWFMEPVDPVALNIPNYFSVVKQPMDLGTMKSKLERGEYESAKDFKADFGLIVKNCVKFNTENNPVTTAVRELEKISEKKWTEKASWISKHAPPSAAPASATSPRGGIKDETDDDDASDAEQQGRPSTERERQDLERAMETLTSRLNTENRVLEKKLGSAEPDWTGIDLQRSIIAHLQNTMVEKRQAISKLTDTKKGPSKASSKKKAAGGGGGSSKKAVNGAQSAPKKASGGAPAAKKPMRKKLTDEEKEIVSEGISRLEENALERAINIIKKDTGIKESEDDELELDMEQLSEVALGKLFDLVISQFPEYKDRLKKREPVSVPAHNSASTAGPKAKKNKPMGKAEQERKLQQLRELKAVYKRAGSESEEPLPSVEHNDANTPGQQQQDSDDDDASSSEEE